MNTRRIAPLSNPQVFVLLGAFLLCAVLFILPRSADRPREESKWDHPETELGLFYVQNGGRPMEGIEILKKVVEEFPADKQARSQLAQMAMMTGQYDKAAGHLERLLDLEEEPSVRWSILAMLLEAHRQAGDQEQAQYVQERMQEELMRSMDAHQHPEIVAGQDSL